MMSPGFSAYLNILRFSSALVVFAHHASYERFDGSWIAWLGGYGHEAVMVFFVLSGFVIAYVVDTKEKDAGTYFSARFSRLYSVALPAIALTFFLDYLGMSLQPGVYADAASNSVWDWLCLLFLNQVWAFEVYPGTNLPYWSLSYEFLYYVLFGVFMFSRRPWLHCTLLALLIGPKIMLLLPAWLLGVLAYQQCRKPFSRNPALYLCFFGLAWALVLAIGKIGNLYITWRWYSVLPAEVSSLLGHSSAFVSDIAIAAGVAMHLVGAAQLMRQWQPPAATCGRIQKISDATFTVYLTHYPALYFFTALSVFLFEQRIGVFIGPLSLLIGILLVSPTESLRRSMRSWFGRFLGAAKSRRTASLRSTD